MANVKTSQRPSPPTMRMTRDAPKIFFLPPDPTVPLLARRSRLFLANGTEVMNLRSVSCEESTLFIGKAKITIELEGVEVIVVNKPPLAEDDDGR